MRPSFFILVRDDLPYLTLGMRTLRTLGLEAR